MDQRTLVSVVFMVSGSVLAGLSVPMIRRMIGPNPWYGFRVRKSLENREVWYEINAYAGRWFFTSGMSAVLVASLVYVGFPGLDADIAALIQAVPVVLILVIGMRASMNRLKTM